MNKPLTSSKTFWMNAIVVIIAALVGVADSSVIVSYPYLIPWITAIIGGLNISLRLFTKVPIQQ